MTAAGTSLVMVKIQRVIFQGDALFIEMIPFNHVLRKCTDGYKLHNSQRKINLLMYTNVKKKKRSVI